MDTPFGGGFPEVVVFCPTCFEQATEAVLAVQQLKTVVLQLSRMDPAEAQRTIDFISGGVHAMDGQSKRLEDTVFLFTPAVVHVSHDPGDRPGT